MMEKESIEYCNGVLDEVLLVLTSEDEEFLKFEETKPVIREINETWAKQQDLIKDCIAAFSAEVEENEKHLGESSQDSTEAQRHKHAQVDLNKQLQHKQELEKMVQDLIQKEKSQTDEKEIIEAEKGKIENTTKTMLPTKRYDVELYHYLTGIRWQYDCPVQEVKGLVASKKKVETFELSKQQNSQFFIANHLWGLIESTHNT